MATTKWMLMQTRGDETAPADVQTQREILSLASNLQGKKHNLDVCAPQVIIAQFKDPLNVHNRKKSTSKLYVVVSFEKIT